MQIKVHRPQNAHNSQTKDQQKKPLRMTLKEYLQSTNLKRRISSRSKSKTKKHSNIQGQDQNYLQPPISHQLIEYFKLNQQWKAKQLFQSWINNLKELTREYIRKDTEYIEVIRLIEKIAEFVKNEIQTIKKDHLLLESYLVSQASYWPAQGSTYNQQTSHDKLSNYLKVLLNNKGESCESPNKSQQIFETFSPELKQEIQRKTHKTSTQPKIRLGNHEISKYESRNDKHQTSSTGVKQSHQRSFPVSQTLEKKIGSNLEKQQYLYSFKDKNLAVKTMNSVEGRNRSEYNIYVKAFQCVDQIDEEEENLQISKFQDPGLLKIHSRNQDDVPRLSLMSRYDEKKYNPTSLQNFNQISKNKNQNAQLTHFSQISTKSQLSQTGPKGPSRQIESKVPLRQRKQKIQKIAKQTPQEFQMIILDPKANFEEKIVSQKLNNHKNLIEKSHTKIFQYEKTQEKNHNSKQASSKKEEGYNYETSPLALRQSPHIVAIETPSTLRRRNQTISERTQNKNYEDVRVNIANPLNPSNHQTERSVRSSSAVYKPSSINFYESTRSNNRQNIMKRYQNFGK